MNRRLRGSDWPLNAPDLNVRRGHSLVRVRSLGPVQSASSHKVGEDGHEVQTMYPSEVSAAGTGFAEFEDSACRNVWSRDYYRDGVAGVESVSNGCRVVRCERNIVGSNIHLVDNVSHQRIDLFERSDLALEVRVVAGDVWGLDVYNDEVLVLCSLDYGLRLSLIVRLNAPCRSSNVDNINARGACDTLHQGCSGDTGASKIKHRLEARQRGTRPCASCQYDICRFLAVVCAFLIKRMLSQSLV